MKYFILLIPFLFVSLSCGESDQVEQHGETEERTLDYTSEVLFYNPQGEEIAHIETAVADDDNSRSEGLMDVRELPENNGMLFIFDENRERNFWMANTPLSLDIIFVNDEYEIVRIHQNTSPYSQDGIPSEYPAKYVVEVNAGFTLRNDITEGSTIEIRGL